MIIDEFFPIRMGRQLNASGGNGNRAVKPWIKENPVETIKFGWWKGNLGAISVNYVCSNHR